MRAFIKALLVWPIIILCGFFVWKICMARIFASDDPQKSLELYPGYSVALLAQNETEFQERLSVEQAEKITLRAKKALLKEPLSDLPFLHTSFGKFFGKRKIGQRELLIEARRRNVHNRRALRILMIWTLPKITSRQSCPV